MAWVIDSKINNGYPWNDLFPSEFRTGFYSDANIKLPYSTWRIKSGVNNGYPWLYWWFKEDSSTDGGEMVIGGSKTNYPNGFTNNNQGGISSQLTGGNFPSKFDANSAAAKCAALGIAYRSWIINSIGWADIINRLNSTDFIAALKTRFEGMVTGVDVFNAIDRIITFPFSLSEIGAGSSKVTAYGITEVALTELSYPSPARTSMLLDFGSITLDVRQAWEIENIEYSIYLPYAGIYQLDVRNAGTIRLVAVADLLNTLIEYYVIIDGIPVFTVKGHCGVDISPSNQTGINMSNFIANIPTMVAAGSSIVGGIATMGAGAVGGLGLSTGSMGLLNAGIGLESVGNAMPNISQAASKIHIPTIGYNSPSIGGSSGTMAPVYPRLMAKIPNMHHDAEGFGELIGYDDQVHRTLSECSGFVKCNNYKCDIIVATDAEKAEIEQLMNAGVFI